MIKRRKIIIMRVKCFIMGTRVAFILDRKFVQLNFVEKHVRRWAFFVAVVVVLVVVGPLILCENEAAASAN